MVVLFALCFIAWASSACCPRYAPNLGGGYDILKPNEAVKQNPLGFINLDLKTGTYSIQWDAVVKHEGDQLIVSKEFLAWVMELEQEIVNLRKFIKGK
jgi:hypothetical protein